MALTPIVELGVDEAYGLLAGHFGRADLPPLEAIENEDWGRDYILGRFLEYSDADLADAGLRRFRIEDEPPCHKITKEATKEEIN